jgi:branched-chain amino acid transport system substrate-binding protein
MRKHLLASALLGLGLASPSFAQDIPVATAGPMTGNYATFGAQM